jgi:hypothetical protein
MDGISYILGRIERICKVEAINDCPLLLDFEIVVLEISRYLFLHSCAVRINKRNAPSSWRYCTVKDIMTWRNFGWNAFQVGTCEGGLDNLGTGRPSGYSAMTKSTAARFCILPWK